MLRISLQRFANDRPLCLASLSIVWSSVRVDCATVMRAILINTGTELLLGDVQDAHLAFIAREILPLGLRIEERRTVPDSDVIRRTLTELFPHCEILFVTGGLGPTTDDITREMVAESLGLELHQDPATAGLASTEVANAAESNGLRVLHGRRMSSQARASFRTRTEAPRVFI